jgi:uncharacterized membrane protein YoaK (UPF0700 family)
LAILAGLLGVAGMGIQNAMSRLVHPDRVPTTIMTGNTTQVIIDLVDILQVAFTSGNSTRERLQKMIPAIITFASGAILGAFSFVSASFWCLLVPIVVLVGLAVTTRKPVSSESNATVR